MVVFNGIEYSTRNYESNFLGHAVDYGMPIALITPIILFILMQINIKRFYSYDCHWSSFAAALMSAFAFVDYFYGTFYGSIIAMSAYSLIVISNKGLRNNKIKKVK